MWVLRAHHLRFRFHCRGVKVAVFNLTLVLSWNLIVFLDERFHGIALRSSCSLHSLFDRATNILKIASCVASPFDGSSNPWFGCTGFMRRDKA